MGKYGFITVDALIAASILVVVILVASSVMHAGLKMEQEHMDRFEDVQLIENHLDYLMGLNVWNLMDGLEEQITEDITCSYEVNSTDFDTLQLNIRFEIRGHEQLYVLEKRGVLDE